MKIELVDHWVTQFKHKMSIKLAAVMAVLVGILTANSGLIIEIVRSLPNGPMKYALAAGVSIVTFALPTLVALAKQPKLEAKLEEKDNAAPYTDK